MIVDKLENWRMYFTGVDWGIVSDFLASLNGGTPEGEYLLKDDKIFARVMSYETFDPDKARMESHRSYIDIQVVLDGSEGIAWHPVENLEVSMAYDPEKDVEFHDAAAPFPARVDLRPGYFVALFPHDAHMPQLRVPGMLPWVKKVVVKVHVSLFPDSASI